VPRAGLTPDRVVRAAADLADQEGFAAVTTAAVARLFGVRAASVYSHVAGTDDLRTRVALLALDEIADLAAEAVAGRSGSDALAAFADVYRDYARARPGRYEAARLRLEPGTDAARAAGRHAALTRAILRGYGLTGEDQTHAVRLIGSVVHGYATLELSGGFDHSDPSGDVSWRRILDGLDGLLRTWSGGARAAADLG
jgi:AcrR family transcriptional regulator